MKKFSLVLLLASCFAILGAAEFTPDDGRLPKCLLIITYENEQRGLNAGPLSIRALLDDLKKRAPAYGFDRLVTEDDPALRAYMAKARISLKKFHGQDRWGSSTFAMLKPFLTENGIPAVLEIQIHPDPYRGVQCILQVGATTEKWGKLGGFVQPEPPEEIVLEETVDALLEEAADFLNSPNIRKKWLSESVPGKAATEKKPKLIPYPQDKPFPKTALFVLNGTSPYNKERNLPVDEKDFQSAMDTVYKNLESEKMTDLLKCGDPVWNETAKSFGYDKPEELEKQTLDTLLQSPGKPRSVNFAGFARKAKCGLYCRVCVFRLFRDPEKIHVSVEIGGAINGSRWGSANGFSLLFRSGEKPHASQLKYMKSCAATLRRTGSVLWDKRAAAYMEAVYSHAYKTDRAAPPPFREVQNRSFAPEPGKEKSIADAVLSPAAALPRGYRLLDAAIGDDGQIYLAVCSPDRHPEVWRFNRGTAQLARVASAPDASCSGRREYSNRRSCFDVRDGKAVLVYFGLKQAGRAGVFDLKNGSFTPLDFLPEPATGCTLMNGKVYLLFAREVLSNDTALHLVMECDPDGNGRKIVINNAGMEKRGEFDRYQFGNIFAITADPPRKRLLVYSSPAVQTLCPETGKVYGLIDFCGRFAMIGNAGNEVFIFDNSPNLTLCKFNPKSGTTDFLFRAQPYDPDHANMVDMTAGACENLVVEKTFSNMDRSFNCAVEGPYCFSAGIKMAILNMRDAARVVNAPAIKNAYLHKLLPAGDGRSIYLINDECVIQKLTVGPDVERKGNEVK